MLLIGAVELILIASNSTEGDSVALANTQLGTHVHVHMQAQVLLAQIQVLSQLGYATCQAALELYWCLRAFVPCEIYQINATGTPSTVCCAICCVVLTSESQASVALPLYQCQNQCLDGSAVCAEPFRIGGFTLPPWCESISANSLTYNCSSLQTSYNFSALGGSANTTANCTSIALVSATCGTIHELYYTDSGAALFLHL